MFNCQLFESYVSVAVNLVYSSVLIVMFISLFLFSINRILKGWMNRILVVCSKEITEMICWDKTQRLYVENEIQPVIHAVSQPVYMADNKEVKRSASFKT
jgi:hypothetical protein